MLTIKLLAFGVLSSVIWMSLLWWVFNKTKNASYVYAGLPLGVLLYSVVYFFGSNGLQGKEFLALTTLLIWAGRLSYHIYGSRHSRSEDIRYSALKTKFKIDNIKKEFLFFQAKGLLNGIFAIPFLLISLASRNFVSMFDLLAFTITYLAIFGEAVSDHQLKTFQNNSYNKGKVCDEGWWKKSCHPNYFFEIMVWTGFFLLALREPFGILGILAPIAAYISIFKLTGIPASERHATQTYGDLYTNYKLRVPNFIPLKLKK